MAYLSHVQSIFLTLFWTLRTPQKSKMNNTTLRAFIF